jgi:hypothetical protein
MNIIDKYIVEVGKHLPRKNRADIGAEIRSTLEDMIEERKQAQGTLDDAALIELLKEYGAPRKVAESYVGPRYLIGPRIYPFFEMVTRIVLTVVLVVGLAGLAISLSKSGLSGAEFLKTLGSSALSLLGGLITALGNIVLVFIILERVLPNPDFEKEWEDWDPKELAQEPDPDRVSLGGQIFTLFFMILFLVILNLYPNIIGFLFFSEKGWTFIAPVLTKAFFSYLPWINILILLQMGLHLYLLRHGSWNVTSRVANIVLELADIALAVVMLRGPALVAMTPGQFAGTPLADAAEFFAKGANLLPTLVLAVVIFASVIEVVETVNHLLKSRPSSPYPAIK